MNNATTSNHEINLQIEKVKISFLAQYFKYYKRNLSILLKL